MESGKFVQKHTEKNDELIKTEQNTIKTGQSFEIKEHVYKDSHINILSDNDIKTDTLKFFGENREREDNPVIQSDNKRLDDIRVTYQFHTLSPKASLTRRYLLETKKKNEIQGGDPERDSLDLMVSTYMDEEERKKTAKETKSKLKRFWEYKDILAKDPLLSRTEKATALYNYAKTFKSDVEIYRSIYRNNLTKGKRERNIDLYLDRYNTLIRHFEDGSENLAELDFLGPEEVFAGESMLGTEEDMNRILANAKKKAIRLEKHSEKKAAPEEIEMQPDYDLKKYDSTLSGKQYEGLSRTDDWLMGLGIHSPKRLPFINRILALSARERLLVYRLVEKGHLAKADIVDIAMSQTDYVPDVSKISFKMYRVPFRLWEKAGKDGMMRHHWDMLEAALSIVSRPEVSHAISGFAESSQKETKSGKKSKSNDLRSEIDEIKDDKMKGLLINVYDTAMERDRLVEDAISALEEAVKAREKSDNAWIRKSKKEKAADRAMRAAAEKVNTLFEYDRGLNEKQKQLRFETGYTGESAGDVVKEVAGDSLYGASQALGVVSKISMIPNLDGLKTDIVTAWLTAQAQGQVASYAGMRMDNLLTDVNKVAGGAAAVKGAIGLLTSLKGFSNIRKAMKNGNLSGFDRAYMAGQYFYGLSASAASIGIGVTNMAYASTAAQALLNKKPELMAGVKSNLTIAGAAVSAGGLLVNVADYALQAKHYYHRHKANQQIEDLKTRGAIRGDDETYMDGITRLDTRNKRKQAVNTTFSAATNAGNLAALFAGPAAALVWSGLAVGVSLANKLTDYLLSERSKAKTAEEFLNLNDLTDILEGVDLKVKEKLKNDTKKMKEFKKTLMNHMAAELGFTTFRTFFKHITGKYGEFLFRKLFYNDNDELITESMSETSAVSQACAQLVKGMGLRVRYPKSDSAADVKKIRPAAQAIAAKLGG